MKKLFLYFVFCIIMSKLFAQGPVIPGSAIFLPGESYTLKNDTTHEHLATLYVGDAGENIIWNFQDILTPNGDTVRYDFTTAQSQPFSAAFIGANVAQLLSNNPNINFFEANETGFKTIGTLIPNGSGSYYVFQYTNPLQNMILPLQYNDTYVDTFSCLFPQLGTSYLLRTGTITNTNDAYGTLLLPGGVVHDDVIRVKTEYVIYDIFSNNPATTDTTTETFYAWYRAEEKTLPILQIGEKIIRSYNPANNSSSRYIRYKTGQNLLTWARNLQSVENGVVVYPNPTNSLLNIRINNNTTIDNSELFDYSGRLIYSIPKGIRSFDVSTFEKGVYFLRVNQNNLVTNTKIIIY